MRSRSLVFAFGVSLILACNTGKAASPASDEPSAPSDTNTPPPTTEVIVDGGTESSTSEDSSVPTPVDSGPKAPTNQAECVAVCESKYPKPAALNKQLDATCFLGGSCEPVCNNHAPGGQQFPVSAGDAGDSCLIADGIDPIMTLSQACSDCIATTESCCKLWVDIFGSEDGRNLNKCAVKCFSDFKN